MNEALSIALDEAFAAMSDATKTLVGIRLAVTDWHHGEMTSDSAMRAIRALLEIGDAS